MGVAGAGAGTIFGGRLGWTAYWATHYPSGLALTVNTETQITLDWTNNGSLTYDSVKIERSDDLGLNYSVINTSAIGDTSYISTGLTDVSHYYYRIRYIKDGNYSAYSNIADDWTAKKFTITPTGTGAGVARLSMWVDTLDIIITLDGTGRFYDDIAGTINEGTSRTVTTGALRYFYIKVPSGTSNLLIFAKNNWKRLGDDTATGWLSDVNKPLLTGVITNLTSLTHLYLTGNSSFSGSIANLISLIYFRIVTNTTISGSVANLTSLTYLSIIGTNTLSGSVTNLTSLTNLMVTGSNTLSGSITGLTHLIDLTMGGSNTLTGDVAGLSSIQVLQPIGSNTISGSITGLTTLITLAARGLNTISGSVTGLTSLTFLQVEGSNTVMGSVTNLTGLTYLVTKGNNTISGDLGVNNVVNGITTFDMEPCAMVDYTAGATWSNAAIRINPGVGYGYSATEIDNMLIDMAASPTLIGKTITLQGSSAGRTAASDAAVATLQGAGRLCTVNTN